MIMRGFALRLSGFAPRRWKESELQNMLDYAACEDDLDEWLGKRMLLAFLSGLIALLSIYVSYRIFGFFYLPKYEFPVSFAIGDYPISFVFPAVPVLGGLLAGLLVSAFTWFLSYLHLYYVVEGRATWVEQMLPDFLLLVASNINAGMTPFAAFQAAARPDFGPLAEEVRFAVAKSLGTNSFSQALAELSARVRSETLQEVASFFSQALKAGGRLAKLVESTAFDLRQTQELKKELQSSTRMYVMFVAFIVTIATPLLLAVSVQFLDMIQGIQSQSHFGSANEAGLGFLATSSELSGDFMARVALVLLAGNALLAGLFMGVLATGKPKMGLKYFPLILVVSLVSFALSRVMLRAMFPA